MKVHVVMLHEQGSIFCDAMTTIFSIHTSPEGAAKVIETEMAKSSFFKGDLMDIEEFELQD